MSFSTEWLEPQSIRLSYRLNNNDKTIGHQLRIIGGPHSFFSRVRLLVGGTMVEGIMDYNRVHNMSSELTGANTKQNEDIEGFGINGSDIIAYTVNNFLGISFGG